MTNSIPHPHPISGITGSFAGNWYKCINPQCHIEDLRGGAVIRTKGIPFCPDCGQELYREITGNQQFTIEGIVHYKDNLYRECEPILVTDSDGYEYWRNPRPDEIILTE